MYNPFITGQVSGTVIKNDGKLKLNKGSTWNSGSNGSLDMEIWDGKLELAKNSTLKAKALLMGVGHGNPATISVDGGKIVLGDGMKQLVGGSEVELYLVNGGSINKGGDLRSLKEANIYLYGEGSKIGYDTTGATLKLKNATVTVRDGAKIERVDAGSDFGKLNFVLSNKGSIGGTINLYGNSSVDISDGGIIAGGEIVSIRSKEATFNLGSGTVEGHLNNYENTLYEVKANNAQLGAISGLKLDVEGKVSFNQMFKNINNSEIHGEFIEVEFADKNNPNSFSASMEASAKKYTGITNVGLGKLSIHGDVDNPESFTITDDDYFIIGVNRANNVIYYGKIDFGEHIPSVDLTKGHLYVDVKNITEIFLSSTNKLSEVVRAKNIKDNGFSDVTTNSRLFNFVQEKEQKGNYDYIHLALEDVNKQILDMHPKKLIEEKKRKAKEELAKKVTNLTNDLNAEKVKSKTLQDTLNQTQKTLQNTQLDLKNKNELLAKKEKELADLKRENANLTSQKANLEREIATLKSEKADLETKLASSLKEQENLNKQLNNLKTNLAQKEKDLKKAQDDLIASNKQRDNFKKDLDAKIKELTELTDKYNKDLVNKDTQITNLKDQIALKDKEIETLKKSNDPKIAQKLATLEKEKEELLKQKQALEGQKKDLETQIANLQKENKNYLSDFNNAKSQIKKLEGKIASQITEIEKLKKDLANSSDPEMTKKLAELEKQKANLEKELAEKKSDLSNAEKKYLAELDKAKKEIEKLKKDHGNPNKPIYIVSDVKENGYYVAVPLAKILDEIKSQTFSRAPITADNRAMMAYLSGATTSKEVANRVYDLLPLLHSSSAKVKANTLRSVSSMIDNRNTDLEVIKDKDLDRTFWMKAYGMFDELNKSKNGAMGYKGDHYGAILGFDSFVSDNLNLGLALAYTKSDIDSKGNAKHNLKSDIVQVYGYGDLYLNNNLKLDFKAGVGFADNDGKRTLSFANKTAKSNYDSNIYMAGLGLSYDINLSNLQISPFLRADYIYVKDDGYTETGADMFNLKVNSNDYDSLLLRLGVKGSYKVADKFGLFGDVSLGVETLDTDAEVKSKFKSTKSFVTKYESDDNIYGQLSLGAFYKPTISSEISLNYGLEKSKDYDSHKAMLGFKYSF